MLFSSVRGTNCSFKRCVGGFWVSQPKPKQALDFWPLPGTSSVWVKCQHTDPKHMWEWSSYT